MKKEDFENAVIAPFQDVYLTVRLAKEKAGLTDDEIADAMRNAEEIAKKRVENLTEGNFLALAVVLDAKTQYGIMIMTKSEAEEAEEEVDERGLS